MAHMNGFSIRSMTSINGRREARVKSFTRWHSNIIKCRIGRSMGSKNPRDIKWSIRERIIFLFICSKEQRYVPIAQLSCVFISCIC